MFIKMESFMRIKSILFVIPLLFLSCEEAEEQNAGDCAGIVGGNAICGCTDSDATNYNSEATYDDGSCEYDPNMDCAGIVGGNSICGCMDDSAVNYDPAANHDDGSCQYYDGQMHVVWEKEIPGAGEMWSMRPVSDGGFIVACGGAGDCTGGTYDNPCEYYGQLIRLDANGDVVWNQIYEGSSGLYHARETSDGGFIAAGYYECVTSMDCLSLIHI